MSKILIIDDENMIRERLSQLLNLDGFEVITAENGIEGLHFFEAQHPEIMLVDIKMPGINGIDVLKAVNDRSKDSEVIMITGHGGSDTIIQALNEGAFGYVQKPIEYDELLIMIRKALEKITMRRQMKEYVSHLEKAIEEKSLELNLRIQAERALQENIEQAKDYQKKLVTIVAPRIYNMRFYADYIPFTKVGGDIFNIIKIKNKIWFYLVDIAGHGVVAAILSTFIKAHLDRWLCYTTINSTIDLLQRLKELVDEQTIFKENLLAIFIGSIHVETLQLSYINAGQFKPLLFSKTEEGEGSYQELTGTSCPVSDLLKEYKYKEETFPLSEPAKLLLFSDGLIERVDNQGEIISTSGLIRYCRANGLSPESLQKFTNYHHPQSQNDDISYILFDINTEFSKDYYSNLYQASGAIDDILQELRARYPENRSISRVLQCYYELFTNAIEHGHNNDNTKRTHVHFLFEKEKVIIRVRDEGKGFNWQELISESIPEPHEHRGRGLYLVKKLSQSIAFNEQGNEITIAILIDPNNNIL